ncbi:MAG: head-tail adaptor protein [Alphaproteobacteria bacterium]|nr:head-tail adaptor protein [Alphaproteobacteria bacterium]
MARIGQLDRRIAIERNTEGATNAFNEPADGWSPYTTIWARKTDISDREKFEGGQLGSALVSRFVVRGSTKTRTVDTKDRLYFESKYWNIHGVKETRDGRKRFIEITAVRDSDQG